ncbi:6316_t:CDS:2, partial [Gigaspora rosea]
SMNLPNLKLDKIRNVTNKLTTKHHIHVKKVANEESNWMDSSYILSNGSFKFLSRVNNIKGSFNIDNNILKVSWDRVEKASQDEQQVEKKEFFDGPVTHVSFNQLPRPSN